MTEVAEIASVGFVGLGDQGGPMAEQLAARGPALTIWARRREVADRFVSLGASRAASPADLARAADLTCICVTTEADVREVVRDGGVLAAIRPGGLLAVHSTVSPGFCAALAHESGRSDIEIVEAPVSGSGIAAREGRLLVLLGCSDAAARRVRPVFSAFSNAIHHVGPSGTAGMAKLVNNALMAANLEMARSALAWAQAAGIPRATMREVALAGVGRSHALDAILRLEEPARAAHISKLMAKDFELAQAASAIAREGSRSLLSAAEKGVDHVIAAARTGKPDHS